MRARPSPRTLLESWVVHVYIPDGGMRGIRSVREREGAFGRVVHPFLELPYNIAAEVAGVQDERGCSLTKAA